MSLARNTLVQSSLTLVSRLMGFARDLAITYAMGASIGPAADAYNTALSFPNLFRRIFAEGAFAAAFVPAYSRSLTQDGEEVADVLAADAMATLAAATLVITVIAQLAMPWLMYLINPGYAADPEKFNLAVILTQITMPYLPCMAITAHLSGVLNARGRFVLSAAAPTLLNAIMLVAVLTQHTARGAAFAASWAVIVAGVAQAALLWWGVRKTGAHVGFRLPRLTPEIRRLLALALPGAIAASATQINIFVSQTLVSTVPGDGPRSWLAVADRLYQLPLGLVGVAVGVALLPSLSRAVHAGDKAGADQAMDEGLTLAMAFTLPAAAALVSMPYFLIDALFTRGQFHAADALFTAQALAAYGWGVPAFVLTRVLTPAFFARQDTKAPMRFALISVAVNIVLGVILFRTVGFWGIAAATSIAAWINVGQMWWTLRRRGDYRPSRALTGKLAKLLGAAAAMGVVLAIGAHYRPLIEAPLAQLQLTVAGRHLLGAKEITLIPVVAVGAALYLLLLFASRAVRPSEIRQAFRRRPVPAVPQTGDLPVEPL